MNYENAKDLLPEELLKQVQKYAGGKLLYIPVDNEIKGWGEVSGYRQKLLKRNVMICNKYKNGMTLSELADEYFLSLDSIKKIIYNKKDKHLIFSPTIESAICYANAGLIEEWLKTYYEIKGEAYENELENSISIGILKIPLRLVEIEDLEGSGEVDASENMEPLIVHYEGNRFYVRSQKEKDLFLALKAQRVNAYPAFIIVSKREEYKKFMNGFGRYFISVNKV